VKLLGVSYLVPGIVALGALLLFTRNNQEARAKNERLDQQLYRLEKLDADLNQDVLKVRFRLLSDYDSFSEIGGFLSQTASDISELSTSLPEPKRREFRDKLGEFKELAARKAQRIEQFKSENSVLINSLRYLPIASSELLANLRQAETDDGLEESVNRLIQQVFVHSLLPGDEEEPAIRSSLAELADWRMAHPDHPNAAAVATVAAHVTSIIRRKPKVEMLTKEILSVPSQACSEQLQRLQALHLSEMMRKSDFLQRALEGISALLLLGIGYSLYALKVANRSLELRVADRTRALQSEAAEHRRTTDERDRFFSVSLDLLTIAGMDGVCRRVNPAVEKVLGWSPEETLSRPYVEFIHPDDRTFAMEELQRALTSGSAIDVEMRCLCKDGSFRWIAWTTLVDEAGLRFSSGRDITDRKRAEEDLARLHQELLKASRQAGMAEVAIGVLHNVGNVLNSVNVSASLVTDTLKKSKISSLGRALALLDTHASDLGTFLSSDPQGKGLPGYLRQVYSRLGQEQQGVLTEVEALRGNIDHIKEIVAMQQSHARFSGISEVLELSDLVEDALRIDASSLHRHDIRVLKEFDKVPPVAVDKHKMLQILVNLVRNARQACNDSGHAEKRVTLRVTNGDGRARIAISDNGIGVPPENLTRIFSHGFTTRTDGHGFGLHCSALAASEMGGSLRVQSEGPGKGATFIVELPLPSSAN
jgi:PAS domain S-box-containing protein